MKLFEKDIEPGTQLAFKFRGLEKLVVLRALDGLRSERDRQIAGHIFVENGVRRGLFRDLFGELNVDNGDAPVVLDGLSHYVDDIRDASTFLNFGREQAGRALDLSRNISEVVQAVNIYNSEFGADSPD